MEPSKDQNTVAGSRSSLSSRFILDVERQLHRRKHIVLYGNIYDQFLWRGAYTTVDDFLRTYFRELRFDIVAEYDPIDGFRFADHEAVVPHSDNEKKLPETMEARYDDIVRRSVAARHPGSHNSGVAGGAKPVPVAAGNLLTAPVRAIPGIGGPGQPMPGTSSQRRINPEDAFGGIRAALAQQQLSVAATVSLTDMLTSDSSRYDTSERPTLMMLMKCFLEASIIFEGPLRGYRNTLVVKAADLKRIPEWLYRDNPFVSLVFASRPNKDERKQYALNFMRPSATSGGFYDGESLTVEPSPLGEPATLPLVAEEFADMTEGMQAMDLEALRITSWKERIKSHPHEMWRLIDFFKFGVREDPWEKLSPQKVREASAILTKRVIGQPKAVEAVTNMLTSARVGLSMTGAGGRSTKPRGIFFFVGPTGVGKTELAKAVTQLVFGDERAFARFDMSEYKEEHAAEKLAGAPPGFVGYEEGGQLTNRVMEQPHSILLFDEIEKAHPKVLDKFLQVLEDGRLTDGKGQTAYFNQTAIIFTSNIGASDLTDPQTGSLIRKGIMTRVRLDNVDDFPYENVAAHFRTEVDWYFTSRIGRAELLNRLGDNIVAFDLLRPEFVDGIATKFLRSLAEAAQEKYKFTIIFDPSVLSVTHQHMTAGDNLLFGGRRIKSLLETLVERPLNRWLFHNYPETTVLAGKTLTIGLQPASDEMEVSID
jgi:hypothetical protein